MAETFIKFLQDNGFKMTTVILIIIIGVIIANIENVLILKSWIYSLFSKSFSFAKKKQIANKVRGTILKSIKEQEINKDSTLVPQDLKVVWVNEEQAETFVKNNQVIVRIKQSSNPHENLITAVSEYVNNGLLYNVKRYLNKEVMDASRILMTRKVIQSSSVTSLTYLDENYIIPKMNNDPDLKELYDSIVKIDKNGMFIGIMLNEFNKAGMSIYNEIEDPELFAESKEFMRFLYNIAIRLSTEPSDLCFNRDYFKVAVFLTASNRTLRRSGIRPFINAINKLLEDGIRTIYVFGLGSKRTVAEQISEELDSDFRISTITKHVYKHINESGRRIPGVFYECQIYKDIEEE